MAVIWLPIVKIKQSNYGMYVRFPIITENKIHVKLLQIKTGIIDGNEYQNDVSKE